MKITRGEGEKKERVFTIVNLRTAAKVLNNNIAPTLLIPQKRMHSERVLVVHSRFHRPINDSERFIPRDVCGEDARAPRLSSSLYPAVDRNPPRSALPCRNF